MFGTARVIWAMLMLTLFHAAGVLVHAPRPPKAFRPGCGVQDFILFALLVIALLHSYSLVIEWSAFIAITAIGSAATWVTPLQVAHRAISIHSAGERSIMMMIAFITIKSSLVPLIEGLCAQIYFRFEISVVCSHLQVFFFVKEKTC